jgi:hypothetical protein
MPTSIGERLNEALKGKSCHESDRFRKRVFFLREQTDEKTDADRLFPTMQITDTEGSQLGVVQDPSFGILAPDVETRLAVINELRSWFDCDREQFERKASEIAALKIQLKE